MRAPLEITVIRELLPTDLPKLLGGVPRPVVDVKSLRASHHRLAQAIAKGATNIEASAITGYTTTRVSQLRSSPAFKELIAHYSDHVNVLFEDVVARMKTLSMDALEEIQRRLDEMPESLRTEDLLKVATTSLDRTGHGPTSSVNSTVVHLSPEIVEAIKARSRERGVVIDAQSYRPIPSQAQDHQLPPIRDSAELLPEPGLGQSEKEEPGRQEEGALV